MKNLIEILPNIYGVKIDADSTEIQITNHAVAYKSKSSSLPRDTNGFSYIEIGLGELRNFKILGFLTKDKISFDASSIVKSTKIELPFTKILNGYSNKLCFIDYKDNHNSFNTSEQSFRSALPDEIYFENPFEKPNKKYYQSLPDIAKAICEYDNLLDEYESAQKNITEKLLILQKL